MREISCRSRSMFEAAAVLQDLHRTLCQVCVGGERVGRCGQGVDGHTAGMPMQRSWSLSRISAFPPALSQMLDGIKGLRERLSEMDTQTYTSALTIVLHSYLPLHCPNCLPADLGPHQRRQRAPERDGRADLHLNPDYFYCTPAVIALP